MFKSYGHLTFDPCISYMCQRMASRASESEGAKCHRKTGFFKINPTKRGFQGGCGQENHLVSKALAFFAFLKSNRLLRGHHESSNFLRNTNNLKNSSS